MINNRVRVLLVDDDEDDYMVARDLLEEAGHERYTIDWISNYDDALDAISSDEYDVFLFDFNLGARTGIDLMREAIKSGCKAPVIILTGQEDHELDIEAMKAGASDYLIKGEINAPLMERSIRYAIERKRAEQDVFEMAYYDILTGLPNRALFQDRLQQALSLAGRRKTMLAVLFLDVDNFKRINDTFGHMVGDQLLREIAERLSMNIRKSDSISRKGTMDIFARLGGDEFTAMLDDIRDIESAARVAQRIIDSMSEPFVLNDYELFVTTSIGIAIYPNDGESIETILKNADAAMYHAKAQGKNNYQYYQKSMNAAAFEKLSLENDLRRGIEREETILHYQPQIDATTGELVGVEALVRWVHPERGIVSPAEFIPVAEESGLIIPLTHWVLKTACWQNMKWQQEGLPPKPVSVNLTSLQFQQKNFTRVLHEILNDTGIRPHDLVLEITESTIMENSELILNAVNDLNDMGMRLMIDDFGTGYSSLSYLKRFPIYAIKIDRSFVKDINTDPDNAAIVEAIISMAHSLKLKVVAEGVETEEQFEFLKNKGCQELQGFLFSRPVPAEEISRLLQLEKEGTGIGISVMARMAALRV